MDLASWIWTAGSQEIFEHIYASITGQTTATTDILLLWNSACCCWLIARICLAVSCGCQEWECRQTSKRTDLWGWPIIAIPACLKKTMQHPNVWMWKSTAPAVRIFRWSLIESLKTIELSQPMIAQTHSGLITGGSDFFDRMFGLWCWCYNVHQPLLLPQGIVPIYSISGHGSKMIKPVLLGEVMLFQNMNHLLAHIFVYVKSTIALAKQQVSWFMILEAWLISTCCVSFDLDINIVIASYYLNYSVVEVVWWNCDGFIHINRYTTEQSCMYSNYNWLYSMYYFSVPGFGRNDKSTLFRLTSQIVQCLCVLDLLFDGLSETHSVCVAVVFWGTIYSCPF